VESGAFSFPEDFMKEKKFDPRSDYPLASQRPDLLKTLSGLDYSEISLENVTSGKIPPQEIRISPETLEYQARIAETHGRFQLAANFRRAAELTMVPDEEVLKIYNALRPHQATKEELIAIAKWIEKKYQAKINARFIREAVEVYERRDLLKKEQRMGENHG
jgi:propanediol dehydratase small subunit